MPLPAVLVGLSEEAAADKADVVALLLAEHQRLRREWAARNRARSERPPGYWDAYRAAGGEGDPDETLEEAAAERLAEWEEVCTSYAGRLAKLAMLLYSRCSPWGPTEPLFTTRITESDDERGDGLRGVGDPGDHGAP